MLLEHSVHVTLVALFTKLTRVLFVFIRNRVEITDRFCFTAHLAGVVQRGRLCKSMLVYTFHPAAGTAKTLALDVNICSELELNTTRLTEFIYAVKGIAVDSSCLIHALTYTYAFAKSVLYVT